MRILLTSAALAALLLAAPRLARAQESPEDAEITRMAKEHYKLGLDAFKAGKYTDAIKELKKAYLLKRLPALLVNIAKTYDKLSDVENEIYYYKKYLAEAPPDARDRDQIKQALAELEDRKKGHTPTAEELPEASAPGDAQPETQPRATHGTHHAAPPPVEDSRATEPPPGDEPPAEPAPSRSSRTPRSTRHATAERPDDTRAAEPPASSEPPPASAPAPVTMPSEWAHTPIDSAPPGRPVDVRVSMPVMKGVKVYLYYRGAGQPDFASAEMKRHGAEKVARIPGTEVQGKSFQYYIEAKDKTGAVVKSSGSQTDPNIVMIDPSAQPQTLASYHPHAATAEERAEEVSPSEPAPPPAASSEDEAPPMARKKRNIDEESAPLGPGSSAGADESPARAASGASAGPRKRGMSTMSLIGYGLLGGGVLIAGAGGGVSFYYSGVYSNAVANDACTGHGHCPSGGAYIFNDPSTADNDKSYQDRGHLADLVGGITVGVGAAAAVTGATLVILDYVKHRPAAAPSPRRRHKKPKAVEAPPVDDTTPPPASSPDSPAAAPPSDAPATPPSDAPAENPPGAQSSLIHDFIAAPIVSPTTVGVGAGFTF